MRCKVGDLAITYREPHVGKMFEVVSPCPAGRFTLPNGVHATNDAGAHWVLRSLSGPISNAHGDQLWVFTHDHNLYPINPDSTETVHNDMEVSA